MLSRRTTIILLLFIVVAGTGLRAHQLTARSLWFDEAFSWRLIQFPVAEMIARDAADVHPPLYYLLLKVWSSAFGTSLAALRAFSTTAAALTLLLTYTFTATAFRSRRSGLIATALMATAGFQIQYAWEARMYTLGTAAILLSSWLLIRALRQSPSRLSSWLWYGLVTTVFAYIHYYAFFSIAAHIVFLLGYLLVTHYRSITTLLTQRRTWHIVTTGVLMFLLYLPWIPTFIAQNSQVQAAYWIPPIGGWSIPDTFYRMFIPTAGIPRHQGIAWIALAATPITLVVLGWLALLITDRQATSRTRDATWLVVLSGAIPFALSIALSFVSQSLYQDRFFVFANLFIIIALATLIVRLKHPRLVTFAALIAIGGLLSSYVAYWHELDIANRPGAHAATQTIYQQRQPNEPVIVTSPFVYFAILHYAQEEFNDATPKLYSETGQLSHFAGGPILTPQDIVGSAVFEDPTHDTLWVVDTTGFGSSKQALPASWHPTLTTTDPEVFTHQGDVFVTKYERTPGS